MQMTELIYTLFIFVYTTLIYMQYCKLIWAAKEYEDDSLYENCQSLKSYYCILNLFKLAIMGKRRNTGARLISAVNESSSLIETKFFHRALSSITCVYRNGYFADAQQGSNTTQITFIMKFINTLYCP